MPGTKIVPRRKPNGISRLADTLNNQMRRHADASGPSIETGTIAGGALKVDSLDDPIPLSDCSRMKGVPQPGEDASVLIVWSAAGPIIIGEIEV